MRNWSTPAGKRRYMRLPAAFLLVVVFACAQQNSDVHILPVRKNIYMLVGAGGNITVSAGPDGSLLVDSGRAQLTDKVLAAVHQLGLQLSAPQSSSAAPPKPIQFIINTSVDADHTGGNEKIAKSGRTF